VCWIGDWRKPPNFEDFSELKNVTVTPISHSTSVKEIWSRSQVLTYGADSHIRTLKDNVDGYPICKIAIDGRQRSLIADEFSMLKEVLADGGPVVRVHSDPLQDDDGIFGFRMEKLNKLDLDTAANHISQIENAFKRLHRRDIVHNDISPSNIMLNGKGRITIIDFGRAGRAGTVIPAYKTNNFDGRTFAVEKDRLDVARVIGTLSSFVKDFRDS
jgi:predicted Ser/Thr protein kinase